MKRFLSWFVLVLCAYVFRVIISWFFIFALWLFDKIYGFSEVLFWVLVVLEGSGALIITIAALFYGSQLVVKASEAVKPSVGGTRYVVVGVLHIVVYGLLLLTLAAGVSRAPLYYILAYIGSVVFGIILVSAGASRAKEGKPEVEQKVKDNLPSKKEAPVPDPVDNYVLTAQDEEYIMYLRNNNPADMYTRREDYVEFYKVLVEYLKNGKKAAVNRFENFASRLVEDHPDDAIYILSYLCGALCANGIVTKEESDELSEKYRDMLLPKMLDGFMKKRESAAAGGYVMPKDD